MNLKNVLWDVETGKAGKEQADWLRGFYDWIENTLDRALDRVWRRDEQIAAIGEERDKLQAELDVLKERRCETCFFFHTNSNRCGGAYNPLDCVMNDYSEWEAKA